MDKSLIKAKSKAVRALLFALCALPSAFSQTHTLPGSNLVPSGASLTIQSGGSITAAAGSTVTGFGGAGGTPGGSNTQVQFNDVGAFGGDTGLVWDKTNDILTITTNAAANGLSITGDDPRYNVTSTNIAKTPGFVMTNGDGDLGSLFIGGSTSGYPRKVGFYYATPGGFAFINSVNGLVLTLAPNGSMLLANAAALFGWSDAGLGRNAAGVIEVDNGTAGTYRDILTRGLRTNAVTFANRIASPVEGTYQAFTDSTTNVSGATITGGGSNHVSGYYNGTNWVADSGNNGLPNVTNDAQIKASDFPASSVDGEISLFSGTTGKAQKRATGTGIVTAGGAGGVYGTITQPAGTVVGTTDTQTLTNKRVNPRVTTIASNATLSPNADTDDIYAVSLLATAVTTISAPTGTPVDGQKLIIRVISDSSIRAISGWNAIYRLSTALPAPSTTVTSTTHTWGFMYNTTAAKCDCLAIAANP
jgi:hypothetical protein